jgi:hypothetical protein
MPAAVLADLLHLAPGTAVHWMHEAGFATPVLRFCSMMASPGMRRFYTEGPHGNRLEFLETIHKN